MQVFIPSLSGQDEYLLLTMERKTEPHADNLAQLPAAIAFELLKDNVPKFKPVERKIKEGYIVKVRSDEKGSEKIKGR